MITHGKNIKIFAANSNPGVAKQIADALGIPLGQSEVTAFSDGEISVSIKESVRGSIRSKVSLIFSGTSSHERAGLSEGF